MSMEMTLQEKIKAVVSVIEEARTVQKTNPVYVPVAYFKPENLGFPNSRDVFRILRENDSIKKITGWWGYDEIEKDKKQVFVKTSQDESITNEDYRVYEIEIDEQKWVPYKKLTKSGAIKDAVILNDLIFDEEGLLYSKSNPEKSKKFVKDTGRYKILNALIDANGSYVPTEMLRKLSDKEKTRSVQKEIGEIKKRIAKLLGIKRTKEDEIIEAAEYSGYRLLIKIRKSK